MVRGVDRLYINLAYALMDQNGELHPPKDANRIEISLTQTLQALICQQVLSDASAMADQGMSMAPGFLRAMGREQQAMVAAARLQQQPVNCAPTAEGEAARDPAAGVRGGRDPRREGHGGEPLVPGALGGLSPLVGGMADVGLGGAARRPSGLLGAGDAESLLQTEAAQRWKEEKRRRRRLV